MNLYDWRRPDGLEMTEKLGEKARSEAANSSWQNQQVSQFKPKAKANSLQVPPRILVTLRGQDTERQGNISQKT